MKEVRFVFITDTHFGQEKLPVGGKLITKPTHNLAAIKSTLQFVKDFQPNAVILGGDQLNCGPVSHWLKGLPRLTEGFRLKDELDLCEEYLLTPLDEYLVKPTIKVWHLGNHEIWLENNLNSNPGLEGLVEPEKYLQLRQRGYELKSQGEISKIGKLHFVHGDVVLGKGNYTNPAKRLVECYRRNIRAGHLHTYAAHIETTPIDRKDYHSGIVVPSLSTRCPAFIKYNPTNYCNGFLWGYIRSDGNFSDYCAIISNGEVTIEGTTYGKDRKT